MKKKISLLLVTIFLLNLNIDMVSADITAVRSRASLNVGSFTGKNEKLLHDGGNISGGIKGARITMTDKNGEQLSGSKTFEVYYTKNYPTSGSTSMNDKANLHFYNKNKTNKNSTFNGGYEWGTYQSSMSVFTSTGFSISWCKEDSEGKQICAPSEDIKDLTSNEEVKNYFDKLSQSINDEWETFGTYDISRKLLKKFGVDTELLETDIGTYKNGIYIVIEPITSYLFGNDYAQVASDEYLVTSCTTENCLQASTLMKLSEYEAKNKALIDIYFSIEKVNTASYTDAEAYFNKYLYSKTNTANISIYNDFWGNTSDDSNSAIYNWCEQSVEEKFNTLKTFNKIDGQVNDVYSKPKWKAFCRSYPTWYASNNGLYANKYAVLTPYKNSIIKAYNEYLKQHEKLENAIKAAEGIFYFTGTPSEAYQFDKTWKDKVKNDLIKYCKDKTYFKDSECATDYINSINKFPSFANVNSFGQMTVDSSKSNVENLTYGKNHCNSDYSNYATEKAGCGIMAISVVAKNKGDSDAACSAKHYEMILSGESLTKKIKINNNKQDLLFCCTYQNYGEKFQSDFLKKYKTIEKATAAFEESVKPFCPDTTKKKCGVSEYNYIEKNGNSILKNDIPGLTVIDKTTGKERQAKYEDCCTADYYDLPLIDGKTKITKDDIDFLNENYCKQKQCGIDEIKSLLGLSSDDPNRLNALECCNISAFEGNEEFLNSTIKINNKNKVVKTLFDSESGILKNAEKYCPITSGVCTFTDTIAKGIRYKNGVEKAENDCCNWNNYGKTKEEKMQNSKATYNGTTKTFDTADSFTKFIVSIPEYSKICPNTKCTTTDLQNILSGIETDKEKIEKCCVKTGYDNITLNSKIGDKLVSSFFTKDGGTKLNSKLCHSDYCTIDSIVDGKTECCTKPVGKGLSAYSPSDKLKYSTESGLETAIINLLGKTEYYRLCKPADECFYDVEGECPNCDNDKNSSGNTTDLVRGEDSTKLDVSDNIKKCITENSDYLSSTSDLSSKYCKVYCTQKVEYNYPKKGTLSVSAGRYILVGGTSGSTGRFAPIQTKVVMTCRVTDVNEAQFKADLAAAVKRYKEAYNAYSNAKIPLQNKGTGSSKQILNTTTETKSGSATCDCKNWQKLGDHDEACCSSQQTVTITQVTSGILTKSETNPTKSCARYSQTLTPSVSSKSQCTSSCGSLGVQDYHYDCTYPNGTIRTGYKETAQCNAKGYGGTGSATYSCTCKTTCEEYSYSCPTYGTGTNISFYTLTSDNTKCVSYSCANEITYNGQKAYLVRSESSYGPTLTPKCVYAYCTSRNYERYPYQTVTKYNYGVDNQVQTARSTPQCSSNCNGRPIFAVTGNSVCPANPNYYETTLNDALTKAQKELKEAKAYYDSVIENYSKCFKVNENIADAIDVNIEFDLSYYNSIYSLDTRLKKVQASPNLQSDYRLVNSPKYEQCVFSNDKLTCSKKVLETRVYENMKTINSVRIEKEFNYYLPDNAEVYTSVNKSSVSKLSKEKELNNVNIGKHLPVAYNEKDNYIEITLTPTVTSSKLRSSEFKSKICTNSYECKSKPGGGTGCIIPVYRPIDLNDPFPDQDDKGRQTGVNWCASDSTGCSNTNTLVTKVITNNRNVKTNEVYNLTPLYTIRLTPPMIKRIKEYNSTTTYGDYNLICDEGTGKHCRSLYLRGEADKEGNVIQNNLKALGAVITSQSCALTENLRGCQANGLDYYMNKQG